MVDDTQRFQALQGRREHLLAVENERWPVAVRAAIEVRIAEINNEIREIGERNGWVI